jgi:hypothetical protein
MRLHNIFDMTTTYSLKKVLMYLIAALALGTIFTSYFAPETMIAITNQVWVMCGW